MGQFEFNPREHTAGNWVLSGVQISPHREFLKSKANLLANELRTSLDPVYSSFEFVTECRLTLEKLSDISKRQAELFAEDSGLARLRRKVFEYGLCHKFDRLCRYRAGDRSEPVLYDLVHTHGWSEFKRETLAARQFQVDRITLINTALRTLAEWTTSTAYAAKQIPVHTPLGKALFGNGEGSLLSSVNAVAPTVRKLLEEMRNATGTRMALYAELPAYCELLRSVENWKTTLNPEPESPVLQRAMISSLVVKHAAATVIDLLETVASFARKYPIAPPATTEVFRYHFLTEELKKELPEDVKRQHLALKEEAAQKLCRDPNLTSIIIAQFLGGHFTLNEALTYIEEISAVPITPNDFAVNADTVQAPSNTPPSTLILAASPTTPDSLQQPAVELVSSYVPSPIRKTEIRRELVKAQIEETERQRRSKLDEIVAAYRVRVEKRRTYHQDIQFFPPTLEKDFERWKQSLHPQFKSKVCVELKKLVNGLPVTVESITGSPGVFELCIKGDAGLRIYLANREGKKLWILGFGTKDQQAHNCAQAGKLLKQLDSVLACRRK